MHTASGLSNETLPEMNPEQKDSPPPQEVLLAYLSVLQNASDRAARLSTLYFGLRLLLSTVLLALSYGVAKSTEQIAVLGTSVKLAPATLLFTVSFAVLLLLLLEFPQYERARLFAYKAVLLYRDEFRFPAPWEDWIVGTSPWGLEVVEAQASDPALPRWITDLLIIQVLLFLGFGLTVWGQVAATVHVVHASDAVAAVGCSLLVVITVITLARRYWYVWRDVHAEHLPHLALGNRRRRL
jgi:hypothetical protein